MDQKTTASPRLTRLLDTLLPNHCYLCDHPSSLPLCKDCSEELPTIGIACKVCALPMVASSEYLCGECLKKNPTFDRVYSPLNYSGQVPTLINRFKHRGHIQTGKQLSEYLLQTCIHAADRPDALVAVPLHWRHQLMRGFNQAEVIAKYLAKRLDIPLIHPLRKVAATRHQQQLNRRQRMVNNQHAFKLKHTVDYSHLAIVDDVMTTGATAETLSAIFKRNGVQKVSVYALARTPKP